MATIKPFKGIRPRQELVEQVACLPYDVMNSEEAREMAMGNPFSLLHITKSEIDLDPGIDSHSDIVYQKSKENYENFIDQEILFQDQDDYYYIYGQTMNGRTQYGIVAGASIEDYENGIIKKHELTRPDKEEDRMINIKTNNANIEPVFFAFKKNIELDLIMKNIIEENEITYDFTSDDEVGHHFWVVDDKEVIAKITEIFKNKIDYTYVADGHHRTASAARVGAEQRENNPSHTGEESYNFFLAVHFPDDQLHIMDYNRVLKDLNGLTNEEFLSEIKENFSIKKTSKEILNPSCLHEFSLYLDHQWYLLKANKNTYNDNDPMGILDVTVLTKHVLEPVLNIKDLRTSTRIDFVGGIRGLGELKSRVDGGQWKAAFALYPVSMDQLINIADTGNIMPPKTTWFEPKLRSGLVIHSLN